MSPRHVVPPSQFGHSHYLRRCHLYGITGHFAWQCSYLPTSTLSSLPPASALAPPSTFTTPYAHTVVHPSTPGISLDWVVDLGASQHVTTDLAALALHASYTASDSVITGDGSGLSIANIGSFSFTSLPTPLFFSNVLQVPAMSENLISVSALCVDNLINVLFFDSFFQVWDHHTGVTLVSGQHRDSVYYCPKSVPFQSSALALSSSIGPPLPLSLCGMVILVIRPCPVFKNFSMF